MLVRPPHLLQAERQRRLAGEFDEGDTALVDHRDDEYTFEKQKARAKAKAAS